MKKILTNLFFFLFFGILSTSAQITIDSLEKYTPNPDNPWDQIDHAIGLGRLYMGNGKGKEGREQIEKLYFLADKYNIQDAKSYALVIENLEAYLILNDADKAIASCIEAAKIAKEVNNKDAYVYATYQLAENYVYEKGELLKGKNILVDLLNELDETVSLKNKGVIYKNLGYFYEQMDSLELSHYYYDKSINIFKGLTKELPIDPKIGRVSSQIGTPYQLLAYTYYSLCDLNLKEGNTILALENIEKAVQAMAKSGLEIDLASMYGKQGVVYSSLGNYAQALEVLQKSRKTFEAFDLKRDNALNNGLMAVIYLKMKDFENAEKLALKNLAYYKEVNHKVELVKTYTQLIEIKIRTDEIEEAKKLFKIAQKINDNLDKQVLETGLTRLSGLIALEEKNYARAKNEFVELSRSNNIKTKVNGNFYLAKVFQDKGEYDSAIYHAKVALDYQGKQKNIDISRDTYKLLSELYQLKGDYKEAYLNIENYIQYIEDIYGDNAQALLKEETVRQDVLNYQKAKVLAEENANQLSELNRLYLFIGIILISMVLVFVFMYLKLRKAKELLNSQNIELQQLNSTKDKFFGIIAHDLRSPLLGLQSVGDQMGYYLKKGKFDKLETLSLNIDKTTKKLTGLLDNLLNWALIQNGMIPYNPDTIDVKEIIEDVISLLQPHADLKQIELLNTIEEETLVHADEKAIHTIVRNIISNAIKYTPKDGKVTVDVSLANEKCMITINDTGTGISAQAIPNLFKLNMKSKKGTVGEKGTGLGLLLCKELVELNKGSIFVESKEGKGSSFMFLIPSVNKLAYA